MAKARGPTLRLRSFQPKKPGAAARVLRPVVDGVPLEDILVALEKSLARAAQHSFETSRAEAGIALGERTLYLVDALNISLKVGLAPAQGPDDKLSHVLVDLRPELDPQACSSIDFRIQAKPLEALRGAQVILADLDPLGRLRPGYRFRGTLLLEPAAATEPASSEAAEPAAAVERRLHPGADREVEVRIVGGDTHKVDTFKAITNAIGQFEFTVDASENLLEYASKRAALRNVDLVRKDDDFFVFALYAARGVDESQAVVSNIIHLDVKRAAQPRRPRRGRG